MKLRHFFFAAMLIGGFAACSDEENLGGVDNGSSEVNAYMTLQIVGPQGMGTKTQSGPNKENTEAGTAVENKISSVAVFLCNDSHIIQSVKTFSENQLTSIGSGVSTPVFEASQGTYQVYVIANPTTELQGLTTGVNIIGQTIENVTATLMENQYAKNNEFLMFNECNGNGDNEQNGASITVTAGNTYDHPATLDAPIELDRLAVKVRTKAKTDGSGVTINGVQDELSEIQSVALQSYKLLNCATKVNLQQKWSNPAATTSSTFWQNILITPSMSAGTFDTPSTDFYNHLSAFRTIGKATADATDYTEVKDTYASADDFMYCMENSPTSNSGAADYGNTTGVVYQWKATVSGSDGNAGANCFYAYNGEYYATLAALVQDYPGVLSVTGGAANATALGTELKTAYDNTSSREEGISAFRAKYKIKVYTEGIMYYTYFIQDQNYVKDNQNNHYYAVMRNTIYDLTVSELVRIGTDIPGGWNPDVDPEDPVDPTNVYMVVQATVNPWVVSSEDITLD